MAGGRAGPVAAAGGGRHAGGHRGIEQAIVWVARLFGVVQLLAVKSGDGPAMHTRLRLCAPEERRDRVYMIAKRSLVVLRAFQGDIGRKHGAWNWQHPVSGSV